MLGKVISLRRFVEIGYHLHCFVNKMNDVGESIPEESANTKGDINARMVQFVDGNNLDSLYPAASLFPDWLNSHQVKDFSNVISLGSHRGASPDDNADALGVFPLVLQIALQQGITQNYPRSPRSRGRYGPGVDGVEISPCG